VPEPATGRQLRGDWQTRHSMVARLARSAPGRRPTAWPRRTPHGIRHRAAAPDVSGVTALPWPGRHPRGPRVAWPRRTPAPSWTAVVRTRVHPDPKRSCAL